MAGGGSHRATLKQKNKSHNHGKHRSKRNTKKEARGKVNVKQLTKERKIKEVLRQEANKIHVDGRVQLVEDRRKPVVLPPRLVVIVSLDSSVDIAAAVDLLKEADLSSQISISSEKVWHVSACQWRKRMSFLAPEFGNLQSVLDGAKVADVILFLFGECGLDSYGEHCLTCVIGQGIPSHLFACQGLSNLKRTTKVLDARKKIDKNIEKRFPGHRVRNLDTWQDAQTLWRQLANLTQVKVHFRDSRPYLLAERVEFEEVDETECGTLLVSGYLRGQSLNVNQLVHLPGWGDFQMIQIDEADDPYPLVKDKDRKQDSGELMDKEMTEITFGRRFLVKATKPESLQSEVILNTMDDDDDDHVWPRAEELENKTVFKIKTLKGVSQYQGQWILDVSASDESLEDNDCDDNVADVNMLMHAHNSDQLQDCQTDLNEEEFADEIVSDIDEPDNYDDQMDMNEERRMYELMKEERQHEHFPDEVDTPQSVSAHVRFARYRGLDNFQTGSWDCNEFLPRDFAKIYRVSRHHFKKLKKLSMRGIDQNEVAVAEPASFITVHVKNVPKSFIDTHTPGAPVTLFGLFPNEQKMTLISSLISRAPSFTSPVKSKDPLIFQIGFRRFSACPVFSEHAYQNKFKMERFLPQSGFIVASMYAPIIFAPAPVLVFRENVVGKFDLVAKGSLLPLDTDRIIVKRVVLTGAPFKINKKSVVVRYMFFNREDIDFYKPLELRTKWGKRGHIKQALGTHGHMKCTFNGQLRSEDTIILNLYKRVFPKWSFISRVRILSPHIDKEDETEEKMPAAFEMFD